MVVFYCHNVAYQKFMAQTDYMKKQYFDKDYNALKRGDYVMHTNFGLCKVINFVPKNNRWYIELKAFENSEDMFGAQFKCSTGIDIELIHNDDDFADHAGFEIEDLKDMGFWW